MAVSIAKLAARGVMKFLYSERTLEEEWADFKSILAVFDALSDDQKLATINFLEAMHPESKSLSYRRELLCSTRRTA